MKPRVDIFPTIRTILAGVYGRDENLIQPDDKIEDFGGDELDDVDMLIEIEHRFGIFISEPAAEALVTVKDIVTLVQSKLA